MSKLNFFTEIDSLLNDKESIGLKVQKTGEELTVLLVPKMQGKTATITISGLCDELDSGFMDELKKPIDKIRGLKSNADEAKVEDLDESEEEEEETQDKDDSKKDKSEAKKTAPKKVAVKKAATKKPEVKETKHEDEANDIENKTTDEIEAEIQKQREEEEAAAKLAEEEAKAKQEAEAKAKADAEAAEKLKQEIAELVQKGDASFKACLFKDAKKQYQEAFDLNPNDESVKEKLGKANTWVERLISEGVIKEETEA